MNMPELCLLHIGGASYIGYNIFTFFTSSINLPTGGVPYYVRIMPDSSLLEF